MMTPGRSSYDNIQRWKVVRDRTSYAILPSPNHVFWMFAVVLPFVAVFYWLIHYKFDIGDKNGLLMADFILFGTTLLLLVISLHSRSKVSQDLRPFLAVSIQRGEWSLPRLSKTYALGGDESIFIAHDYFDHHHAVEASELNLIEPGHDGESSESRTELLHFLGRCRAFDKIGKDLAELGVPFQSRDHTRP